MSRTLPDRTKPGATSASDMCSLPFQSVDDGFNVAQQMVDVEARGDLIRRQPPCHRFIRLDQFPELAAFVGGLEGGPLDDRVGILARQAALFDERRQQAARSKQSEAALE